MTERNYGLRDLGPPKLLDEMSKKELRQRIEELSRQSQKFASLASQRGARMQIMREWMLGIYYRPTHVWDEFLREYREAENWFDDAGVPVREGRE
jgi:hypothetical protein